MIDLAGPGRVSRAWGGEGVGEEKKGLGGWGELVHQGTCLKCGIESSPYGKPTPFILTAGNGGESVEK